MNQQERSLYRAHIVALLKANFNQLKMICRDSAHRIHPMAGQGVNLGFADAACLSEVLNDSLRRGGDVGEHLEVIEQKRERRS